jgi:hypothetical protein
VAGRLEGGGHGQGGGGHGQAGALGQQPAQQQHDQGVAEAEQQGEQGPGQGAADDPVQVVQPVAQDRRPDGQRQQGDVDALGPAPQRCRRRPEHRPADQGEGHRQGGHADPAELLALDAAGAAEATTSDPAATSRLNRTTTNAPTMPALAAAASGPSRTRTGPGPTTAPTVVALAIASR